MVPFVLGAALAGPAHAQAPAGSTAQCRDGTYSAPQEANVACANHGGIVRWYGRSSQRSREAYEPTKAVGSDAPSVAERHEKPPPERSSHNEAGTADGLRLAAQGIPLTPWRWP
jgi:hypothetical protein